MGYEGYMRSDSENINVRVRTFADKSLGHECITNIGRMIMFSPCVTYRAAKELVKRTVKVNEWRMAMKPPGPVKRKRALTLPHFKEQIQAPDGSQQSKDQIETAFFSLPIEIRIMVYEEYLGKDVVHLDLSNQLLTSYTRDPNLNNGRTRRGIDVLPLLRSCKRIYSEAINLLYSTPTFSFRRPPDFLAFYSTIIPQRADLIKHIYFNLGYIARDPCFTYADLKSQCEVRNALPRPVRTRKDIYSAVSKFRSTKAYFYNAAIWSTTGRAIGSLKNLERFVASVHTCSLVDRKAREELLHWLLPMKEGGLDVKVKVLLGSHDMWTWHVDERQPHPWLNCSIEVCSDYAVAGAVIIEGTRRTSVLLDRTQD